MFHKRKKADKSDFIKIKNISSTEDTTESLKTQFIHWGKIFAKHTAHQ